MLVRTPLVQAQQDRSVIVDELPEVMVRGQPRRLTKERLIPLEAVSDISNPNDGPRTLHQIERPSTNCRLMDAKSTSSRQRTLMAAISTPREAPNPKGAQPHLGQK